MSKHTKRLRIFMWIEIFAAMVNLIAYAVWQNIISLILSGVVILLGIQVWRWYQESKLYQ